MVQVMPCQCLGGSTAGVPATFSALKWEKRPKHMQCASFCACLCVWRSVCSPRIDRRSEQCSRDMMLPSCSNLVIVHFPKHSLLSLPPNVADLKTTPKMLVCQQLNFLYHNKSILWGKGGAGKSKSSWIVYVVMKLWIWKTSTLLEYLREIQ